jgi:hypothetical protein
MCWPFLRRAEALDEQIAIIRAALLCRQATMPNKGGPVYSFRHFLPITLEETQL